VFLCAEKSDTLGDANDESGAAGRERGAALAGCLRATVGRLWTRAVTAFGAGRGDCTESPLPAHTRTHTQTRDDMTAAAAVAREKAKKVGGRRGPRPGPAAAAARMKERAGRPPWRRRRGGAATAFALTKPTQEKMRAPRRRKSKAVCVCPPLWTNTHARTHARTHTQRRRQPRQRQTDRQTDGQADGQTHTHTTSLELSREPRRDTSPRPQNCTYSLGPVSWLSVCLSARVCVAGVVCPLLK
jgi:hypothetical protein